MSAKAGGFRRHRAFRFALPRTSEARMGRRLWEHRQERVFHVKHPRAIGYYGRKRCSEERVIV